MFATRRGSGLTVIFPGNFNPGLGNFQALSQFFSEAPQSFILI